MNRYKNIVTLDWETYYDAEYTLRKLSNTSYIRDSRFKAHGVGIKKNTWTKPRWYPHSKVQQGLANIDWRSSALLCHHTHFDGLILSHHYNITPLYYLDTLSMARPLHGGEIRNDLNTLAQYYKLGNKLPNILAQVKGIRDLPKDLEKELGRYCCEDVRITEDLFWEMQEFYPDSELDLIHHTIQLFCDPILQVDKTIAKREHKKEVARKKKVLKSIPYTDKQLRSRPQFAQILRDLGTEPPMKISPTTKKETFAFAKTDQAWIEMQDHIDKDIRTVCEAKLIVSSSIDETRALRLLEHADPALPIYLNYGKAHTLRWTGGDKMNPQNFKRDSELRRAIRAPRGHKIIVVDSSQIEARVNAWMADETELIEQFREGVDVYSVFAAENIYGKLLKHINKTERFVGKVCILALGYQMGWKRFKHTLNIGSMGPAVWLGDDEIYEDVVKQYRGRYREIVNQWKTMENMISVMRTCRADEYTEYGPLQFERGRVLLPNEMRLRYPGLTIKQDPDNANWTKTTYNNNLKIYGGLLTENVIQALARIVVADQIAEIANKYRVVLMVHDEVILCVKKKKKKKAFKETVEAFHKPPVWAPDLPVAGEGGITDYYQKF